LLPIPTFTFSNKVFALNGKTLPMLKVANMEFSFPEVKQAMLSMITG
jgi:hypothetical protein